MASNDQQNGLSETRPTAESGGKKRVIIVGAGIAGISAAVKLNEYEVKDVLVLEAMSRIGGRIHTVNYGDGVIEMGASWLHGEEGNVLYDLAREQHLIADPFEDASVEGEGRFCTDYGQILDYEAVKDVIMYLDGIKEDLSNGSYNNDNQTQSAGHVFREKYQEYIDEKISPFHDLKILWGLFNWYMKFEKIDNACANLDDVSIKTYSEWSECEGVQLINFKNGFQSVVNLLVQHLPEGTIKLDHNVEKINYDEDAVKITLENGDTFEAEHVIVTCSIGFLKDNYEDLFYPPLSHRKVEAIENAGFGTINKIYIEFEEPFWTKQDLGFQLIWTNEEREDLPSWVYDISGFDIVRGQPNLLLCWIGGQGAEDVELESDDVVVSVFIEVLRMFQKNLDITKATNVIRSRWKSNKYIRGAYSHHSIEYERKNLTNDDLVEPIAREVEVNEKRVLRPVILFAGEATDRNYYSTAHGALVSGLREAQRIIDYYKQLEE